MRIDWYLASFLRIAVHNFLSINLIIQNRDFWYSGWYYTWFISKRYDDLYLLDFFKQGIAC